MKDRAVPMIHVPDVNATVDWYREIGFTVDNTYGNEGDGLSFAILSFGGSQVMFNQGGYPSDSKRREVDLYVYTHDVDQLYEKFKGKVDVIEGPHDTFYGMREFIFRDLNRFWITFAQESIFTRLMSAVHRDDIDAVREVLAESKPKSVLLTKALAASNREEIHRLLESAGAVGPAQVAVDVLTLYVGKYKKDEFEVSVTLENGVLFAAPGSQQPLRLMALTEVTFTPIYLDDFGNITFNVHDGRVTSCTLHEGPHEMQLQLIDGK